jgi:hypothetical protein
MENTINTTIKQDTIPKRPNRSASPVPTNRSASPVPKTKVVLKPMSNGLYSIPQQFFNKKIGTQKSEMKVMLEAEKQSNLSRKIRGGNIRDGLFRSEKISL